MKRLTILIMILVLCLVGNAQAKQWSDYTDFAGFPDPTDTLLFLDASDPTTSTGLQKEVTISYFFGAFQLKPVWVDLAGTSTYTIDQSLGNVFFINSVGSRGTTGVSIYLPNLGAGTSQYANRPYWIIDDTVSGTTKIWLVPQFNTSQCTQWVVAGTGVTTSQSGVSNVGHERMDSRMDSVMVIPRYNSATAGVTHYIVEENIH
jgi:hypothetical protein